MTLLGEAAPAVHEFARAHDMLLETRRRDGSWVPTTVNPLVNGDRVCFRTWDTSGKAKRLRNYSEVRLAPSTARGRPTGRRFTGRAHLLHGAAAEEVARRINRKYPLLQGVAVRLLHRLTRRSTQHYEITDLEAMSIVADTVDVSVRNVIRKPVEEVFDAVVDPAAMARYFISSASAPMTEDATVTWQFDDVGAELDVVIHVVERPKRITFTWAASGASADVEMRFDGDGDATTVAVTESSFTRDRDGVERALGQSSGWTDFLCCLKANLEHGVNLREGRTPDNKESA